MAFLLAFTDDARRLKIPSPVVDAKNRNPAGNGPRGQPMPCGYPEQFGAGRS